MNKPSFNSSLLLAALTLTASQVFAQVGSPWQDAVLSGGNAISHHLVVDTDGNRYVTGLLTGKAKFGIHTLNGLGGGDVFVAKLDRAGQWEWAVQGGGSGQDLGTALAVDVNTGELYVTGQCTGTAAFGGVTLGGSIQARPFVAKLSRTGQWRWATAVDCQLGQGRGLLAAPGGGVIVSGEVMGAATFGQTVVPDRGAGDGFVARLTGQGQWQWISSLGGAETETAQGLAGDVAGNVYVTGSFASRQLTLGATTLTKPTTDPAVVVASLDSRTGQWRWAQQAQSFRTRSPFSTAVGTALAVDAAGRVYVTGSYSGGLKLGGHGLAGHPSAPDQNAEIFIARLSPGGQDWEWAVSGGSGLEDEASGIVVTPAGDELYVGGTFGFAGGSGAATASFGSFSLVSHGRSDAFVVRLDTAGVWKQAWFAGGTESDFGRGLALTSSGEVLLTGSMTGPVVTFDRLMLPAGSSPSVFVGRIAGLRPTGVAESGAGEELTVWPNPARDRAWLRGTAVGEGQPIVLLDALGRAVRTYAARVGQTEASLDLGGLPAGVYVVRTGTGMRRLVVAE